jgi:3-deoxy-manno-octulosonate cytidylyltransferase (CMP-KDO synthetase)
MTSPAAFGIIVPARYASTRLPGKPLADLGGKPMILRVLEVAERVGAAFTLVATDDQRIADVVKAAGCDVMLTSAEHANGTDRLAEVARRRHLDPELVVVNLQGDEPALPPEIVRLVAQTLGTTPNADLATLATPIRKRAEVFDPNVVKVLVDAAGRALYFSRAPVPWLRDDFATTGNENTDAPLPAGAHLRHVGLYAYRVSTLLTLSETHPVTLERAESLEQLRALVLGMTIQVALVPKLPAGGVDTPEDLVRVRAFYGA